MLGTLLHNGVPILRSLEISSDATGNRVLAAAIGEATENISAGQSLAGPLAASGHFPPAVVEMIAVAEQANNLENVLLDIADSLERRTWRQLDLAVRLLEPILLAVLAGMVLVLVIALLLPVLKMSYRRFNATRYSRRSLFMSTLSYRCSQRRASGRRGFTLIEVLLVLVILVIMASLAVLAYGPIQRQANINAAKSADRAVQDAAANRTS